MDLSKIDYPYYSYEYTLNKTKIKKLIKDFDPIIYTEIPPEYRRFHFEKYENKYFIIKEDDWKKNEEINNITDIFSEKGRVKCQFGNKPSPHDYWQLHKEEMIKRTYDKYDSLTIRNLREAIYNSIDTKLCNNFRITVALTILKYFKPKSWLDISAGWGDRLLSAIFYNISMYVAADPNKELHQYYNEMIDTFVPKTKRKNFILFEGGFEDIKLSYKEFDIVFTSPPFFDLEKYSTHDANSFTKYKTEKDWCKKFLLKSLNKAFKHLKVGGHMIIYMGGSRYVMGEMISTMNKIATYKGVIYFMTNLPRGIHVWQK